MLLHFRGFLAALTVLVLAIGLCPARADDVAAVKEKLYQAKKEYDGEARKFRKAVTDWLNKREAEARNAGNKKLLDQAKSEREAFEKSGELPPKLPVTLQDQIKNARVKLDKAYTASIKAYVRLKEDKVAEDTEKEQRKFALNAALTLGKRTYLTTLKHSDLKVANADCFQTTDPPSGLKVKLNGEPVPHSIFLHPPVNGSSEVSYPVTGKSLAFRVTVGVTRADGSTGNPDTPLTFEVLGDVKSLWKSQPIAKMDVCETCELKLENVRQLTLRVTCPGSNRYAHAMWYEPILAE